MEPSTIFPSLAQTSSFRARFAVSTIFFMNGLVLASWVPHIPAVKAHHDLSDGQLGIVLLFMAVGALFALPLAGGLISRFGSRTVTTVAALSSCLMLPLPILSPNIPMLTLSLLVHILCFRLDDTKKDGKHLKKHTTSQSIKRKA